MSQSISAPDPRRWTMLPIILSATFMALFDFFVVNVAAPSLVIPTSLVGLGQGLVLPTLIGAVLAGIRPSHSGAAAGVLTTTQQFSAAGVAVLGAVFFAGLGTHPSRADFAAATEAVTFSPWRSSWPPRR